MVFFMSVSGMGMLQIGGVDTDCLIVLSASLLRVILQGDGIQQKIIQKMFAEKF